MSEKIFALLLRLYPADFRRGYANDTLLLMRDRWQDERGVFLRLRLCLDLAADLVMVWLRSQRHPQPLVEAREAASAAPSFLVFEPAHSRLETFLPGMLLSVAMLATFTWLIAVPGQSTLTLSLRGLTGLGPGIFHSGQSASAVPDAIDSAMRRQVIDAVASELRHYANRTRANQLADAIVAHDRMGRYEAATTGPALAGLLTRHIRETGSALGVPVGEFVGEVIYRRQPLPPQPPPAGTQVERPAAALEQYRAAMAQQNCLYEKVETLPHNIAYLKLNGFPDAEVCRATTTAAMASANGADALILDLRDNAGGYGNTAIQIAAYLFERPQYLYDPRENISPRAWTASPVSGSKLADIPVYVLISSQTFSAAEYFTYNMKMLKRATIVGETTRGGQHSGFFTRIDNHFGVAVQQAAPINPYAVKGWEIIGVEPDVKASREDGLRTAMTLAEARQ